MNKYLRMLVILMIGGIVVWLNYAMAAPQKNKVKVNYSKEIARLKEKLRLNPNDSEALRDIGIICFEIEQYPTALQYLMNSLKRNSLDAKATYYLGMTLEAKQQQQLALQTYKRFQKVDRQSPFRKMMEGRYHLLQRAIMREEMRSLIDREGQLGTAELSPTAIAIFPLSFHGDNQEFAPLGKGISEMMITDLSQVPGLTLIERIRLQSLMEEMALGQTGLVDENTAPRMGKLISAGQMIYGTFNVPDGKNLKLDVAFWDVANQESPNFKTTKDALNNLFKLEKDLVFNIIDDLGIQLTPDIREKIQRIPTQNLQAFMAYCIGLELEDAGQFEKAAQSFQKAHKLDPNFQLAAQKVEINQSISSVDLGYDRLATVVSEPDRKIDLPSVNESLIENRLQNMANNIGTIFLPGQDNRKSAEEAQNSGVPIFEDLPLPPVPPPRGN